MNATPMLPSTEIPCVVKQDTCGQTGERAKFPRSGASMIALGTRVPSVTLANLIF